MNKYYKNREELKADTEYIYGLRIPYDIKCKLIDELFESWKNYSPDSPWCNTSEKEYNAADTLVKLSKDGKSNQWNGEHILFNEIPKKHKHKYNLRNSQKT